jgi:cellulose synthase (UDP-forming)
MTITAPDRADLRPADRTLPVESRWQRAGLQLIALVTSAASLGYLCWRAAFTLGADLWLAVPMLLLEVHAALGLGLYIFSLWNLDSMSPPRTVRQTDRRLAVLIPTYNELREVLAPTVAAAVALAPEHETWVLDDGNREWVRKLAADLGARYLARPTHEHAKAGNLNHALGHVDAEIVAVLDADHVPMVDFLAHTVGYFDDPTVAVVQTPQDFYNADSFEDGPNRSLLWPRRRSLRYNEQRLFYRALQPGKNRWNAAFWCGTSALVRMAALRDVGGVACETLTEDIHTTVRMHRRGWSSVFHNEVLAYGLAAADAQQYQLQRDRWGTGAMQLMRLEHPLTGPGLTLRQRLAYATTLLGWFDAWRTLGFIVLPLAVLFTGAVPIAAPATTLAVVFGIVFILQRITLAALSRGYAPQGMAILFEFIRMPTNLRVTCSLFSDRARRFAVTGKGGSGQRHRVTPPRMLISLSVFSVVALAWFALTVAGLTPVTYRIAWVGYGGAVCTAVNLAFIMAAIRRISADRFAADRRRGVRLKMAEDALLDGRPAELVDISTGGALVRCVGPVADHDEPVVALDLHLATESARLRARICSRKVDAAGGALIALQFVEGQDRLAGRLIGTALADISRRDRGNRDPFGLNFGEKVPIEQV